MSFVATTSGITGEDVRDLRWPPLSTGRTGQPLPVEIEWLTDNGSCYLARETRRFARDVGLVPCTTRLESPQSNGVAQAFVRTLKRDYVRVSPVPDAEPCAPASILTGALQPGSPPPRVGLPFAP